MTRGSETLESGDIVRGGEVLTIKAAPDTDYSLDELKVEGLTRNPDGTYTVTAGNGDKTPSIAASFVLSKKYTLAWGAWTGLSSHYFLVGSNLTMITASGEVLPGETVQVGMVVPSSAILKSLTYTPEGGLPVDITSSKSFTMPSANVTVDAVVETVAQKTVTVQPSEHGSAVTDKTALTTGAVTVTTTPDSGWYASAVQYSENSGTTWQNAVRNSASSWTFTPSAAAQSVLVRAEFAQKAAGPEITISSEAELRALAKAVNAGDNYAGVTVKLGGSIALTGAWTPIGARATPFSGTFDGDDKTVSGLTVHATEAGYYGLFGYTDSPAIKNVTVAGKITSDPTDDYAYAGGVAGYSSGTSFVNCASSVTISGTRAYVGGIAGYAHDGGFSDCANSGALSIDTTGCSYDGGNVGGIAGYAIGSLLRCANYGKISVTTPTRVELETGPTSGGTVEVTPVEVHVNKTDVAAGGLVGTLSGGSVTDSANRGSVIGDLRYGGGLVGNANCDLVVTNCYNTAEVRGTSECYNFRGRIGGLVGTNSYHQYSLTLKNCYSLFAGAVDKPSSTNLKGALASDLHGNLCDAGNKGVNENAVYNVSSSYAPADIALLAGGLTAALLNGADGTAWVEDATNFNLGYPMLAWESADTGDSYSVNVSVTPANAKVTVSTKADLSDPVQAGPDGSYSLRRGSWYYQVEAAGYMPVTGTIFVSGPGQTIAAELRRAAQVSFHITPASADFNLTYGGQAVTPQSSGSGAYTYTLYIGGVYAYSAYAEGYSSLTREYEVPETPAVQTVDVTMSKPTNVGDLKPGTDLSYQGTIYGSGNPEQICTIEEGGIYKLGDGATGFITVDTKDPVVLQGSGVGRNDAYDDLYIKCIQTGSDLTLQNVYISNESGLGNTIDFTGQGNELMFADLNILDQNTGASGYAMIHVGPDTDLRVTGGTAYLYKRDQGAGIGGNGSAGDSGVDEGEGQAPEYNGDIVIENAILFMKNSKQGASIGAGAQAKGSGKPGSITIRGSELNMIGISRGAAIGGSAGGGGASEGSDVYVSDSVITINVDYSGAAIGGGGYDAGNDSDGGTLYYTSGSIRTYIDTNAVVEAIWASYGVTAPGVNGNKAITADVVDDSGTEDLYLLELDTTALPGSYFTIREGNSVIYSGGLHRQTYINEGRPKTSQASVTYTMDNWSSLNDPHLYLYLAGVDHTLTVGSMTIDVIWNNGAKGFSYTIKNAGGEIVGGGTTENADLSTADGTELRAETEFDRGKAVVTVDSEALAETLENVIAGTQLVVSAAIPEGETVTETKTVLTRGDMGAIAESGASLKVSSPLAEVLLSNETLHDLAGKAGHQSEFVTVTASVQERGTRIEIAANGTVLNEVDGGLRISLPVAEKDLSAGMVMVMVDAEGSETVIKKSAVGENFVLALVEGSCTVRAVNKAKTFVDVYASHWYADAVAFAASHELFNGISETEFDPTGLMTRGMLVTVLHRLEDIPESAVKASFGDVAPDTWYTDAVHWASENKIVTGYDENSYGPNDSITREQMAVMMYRYVKWLGLDVSAAGSLNGYADRGEISDWAVEAIQWAVGAGLMEGKSKTVLDPAGTATRAEVAAMLQRLISLMIQ